MTTELLNLAWPNDMPLLEVVNDRNSRFLRAYGETQDAWVVVDVTASNVPICSRFIRFEWGSAAL